MAMTRTRSSIGFSVLALLLATPAVEARDNTYAAEIQKWRDDFDKDVRTGGWLELVGRLKLEEGMTTLGSDAGSMLVLPLAAPKRLGTVIRASESFKFEPAEGVAATLDGAPVVGPSELTTKSGSGRLSVGSYRVVVRAVGGDFYLLVADKENPAIASFKGTSWYPLNPSYRVNARFTAYAHPEQVSVPLTHVDSRESMTSTGEVVFRWANQTVRLKSFLDEDQLFVMFQDLTNGRETYGGGRFLYAPLPKSGTTTLDFNKAFNPYCSVNSFVMCPLPPPENRIDKAIAAGEKFEGHD